MLWENYDNMLIRCICEQTGRHKFDPFLGMVMTASVSRERKRSVNPDLGQQSLTQSLEEKFAPH